MSAIISTLIYVKTILPSVIFLVSLASCGVRPAYYFNPFNGTAPTYHTTPLQIDSIRNATYGNILLNAGGANSHLQDEIVIFRPSVYRSHARQNCQFYYGGNLSLGNYSVNKYDTSFIASNSPNGKIINEHAGNKFFGGLGLDVGLNYTIPFRTRHEMRFGTESSFHYEFGDYLNFRRIIPDSAVTRIHRQRYFITVGLFTEFAFKHRNGSVGFKIGVGTPVGENYVNANITTNSNELFPLVYISPAFQYTNDKWTGSIQVIGTARALHFQTGINYRLTSKTKMMIKRSSVRP